MTQKLKSGFLKSLFFLAPILVACSSFSEQVNTSDTPFFDLGHRNFHKIDNGKFIPFGITTALVQDKKGFIWIGSPEGLLRYDGYEFNLFEHDKNNKHSLAGNFVRSLWLEPNGSIWVGMESNGVSIYNPDKNTFTHLDYQTDKINSLSNNHVRAITGDGAGNILVGTRRGLNLVKNEKVFRIKSLQGCPSFTAHSRIYSLLIDNHSLVWIGTQKGLCRVSLNTFSEQNDSIIGKELDEFNGMQIRTLFQASDGKIWLGTRYNGAAFISPQLDEVTFIPSRKNAKQSISHVNTIAQPNEQEIWLGTWGNGITIVDAKKGKVIDYVGHNPADPFGIGSDDLSALLKDTSGLTWVGTWGVGLSTYNPNNTAFRNLKHNPYDNQTLSYPNILSLSTIDRSNLWVGKTQRGIDIITPEISANNRIQPKTNVVKGLNNEPIDAIIQTQDGTVWVGSRNNGLYYQNERELFNHVDLDGYAGSKGINTFKELPDKQLWVGTYSGIALIDLNTKIPQSLAHIQNIEQLANKRIESIVYYQNRHLWIGTNNGLFVLEIENSKLIEINQENTPTLSSNEVATLLVTSNNQLLIGTVQGLDRLIHFDGKKAVFESLDELVGRPAQFSENLLEDSEGRIWDIYGWIDPNNKTYKNLDISDGFYAGTTMWRGSYHKTPYGTLMYGGTEGVLMIRPELWEPWEYSPPIVVSELLVNNQKQTIQDEVRLPDDANSFSVTFAALDYTAPEKNQYAYKLEGYDNEWITTDASNRHATYTNLSPGKYRLRVKGTNRKGVWSEHQIDLPIIQLAAWYETLWFKLVVFFIVVALLREAYKLRVKKLKRNSELLEMKVEERTKQLAESQKTLIQQEKMAGLGTLTAGIMHEINNPTNFTHASLYNLREKLDDLFAFLNELAGGEKADAKVLKLFKEKRKELGSITDTAEEGTKRIKQIVADLSHFARIDKGDKKQNDIKALLESSINLIQTKYPDITFDTEQLDSVNIICYPSKLSQVFLNLLVNSCQAIKQRQSESEEHDGKITLSANIEAEKLILSLSDNGCGMDDETLNKVFEPFFTTKEVGEGTGIGLSIVYSIIEEHEGRISVSSKPQNGTIFTIELPLT